jgi:SAM-dependent methyltransferase
MSEPFERAVPAWAANLGNVRNVVRQRLVELQLNQHIADFAPGATAVDVGCGQGTIAVALAERGLRVIGIDPSDDLLALARAEARGLDATFAKGTLDDLEALVPQRVDVVCCHGVLMYLPELSPAVDTLAGRLKPGGLLSLLTRNQAGIAFRAGMIADWDAVEPGLDAARYANRVGVEDARADAVDAVLAACDAAGADVVAWYGVRVFTDHWGDVAPPPEIDEIVEAEAAAGRRDPYRRVAALTHVVARRRQ